MPLGWERRPDSLCSWVIQFIDKCGCAKEVKIVGKCHVLRVTYSSFLMYCKFGSSTAHTTMVLMFPFPSPSLTLLSVLLSSRGGGNGSYLSRLSFLLVSGTLSIVVATVVESGSCKFPVCFRVGVHLHD